MWQEEQKGMNQQDLRSVKLGSSEPSIYLFQNSEVTNYELSE